MSSDRIWSSNNPRPNRKNYFASSIDSNTSSLPNGVSCHNIVDPQVCCAASDSSDTYKDQRCVPSKLGYQFSSGSTCEPIGWIDENYARNESNEAIEDGICNNLTSFRIFKLPAERSCSSLFAGRACCMARDSNGYPCLPSKRYSTFSSGSKCESATYIAQYQPQNVGTCFIPFT